MAYSRRNLDQNADRLFIVNGELRGVSVQLEDVPLRIGFSSDCDVVLLDSEFSTAEVLLTTTEDDTIVLSEAIGQVRAGRRSLKTKSSIAWRPGTSLRVGSSELVMAKSLSAADHAMRSGRRVSVGVAWAASVALIVAVIGGVGFLGGDGSVVAQPASLADARATASSGDNASPDRAGADLRLKLAQVGLEKVDTFVDPENMTVSVTGILRESERTRWQDVRSWFDARHGTAILMDVDLQFQSGSVTLPFEIKSVWRGNAPRLTLHDGSKRVMGDLLPGDWRLEEIGSKSITISKNEETLVIPL